MSIADPGLFGPHSVTWRIHGDPISFVGGLRALLLQALHPLAMAGVEEHSNYRADPWGRLSRTSRYVSTATFGTTEEAAAAGVRVRAVHAHIRGVDKETGQAYAAGDPQLLAWVHNCTVDSMLDAYRRSGARLSAADADAYVQEQTAMAALVGLEAEAVPSTVAALGAYFGAVRPDLRMTAAARGVARFGVAPPMPVWVQVATPARLAWAGVSSLAFAMLPGWARRMYGVPVLPGADLATDLAVRALRSALLAVPESMRRSPAQKAALQRLAESA
ncbi:MAG: hypothetical protein QOG52_1473 [Frankiaceae bacterium]|nr:hypothetical protein [Frankiaceae bacterium]